MKNQATSAFYQVLSRAEAGEDGFYLSLQRVLVRVKNMFLNVMNSPISRKSPERWSPASGTVWAVLGIVLQAMVFASCNSSGGGSSFELGKQDPEESGFLCMTLTPKSLPGFQPNSIHLRTCAFKSSGDKTPHSRQVWTLTQDTKQIINQESDLCATILRDQRGSVITDDYPSDAISRPYISLTPCSSAPQNQQWTIQDGKIELVNPEGFCMAIEKDKEGNRATVSTRHIVLAQCENVTEDSAFILDKNGRLKTAKPE